jgi:DNA topoisomerase I
MKQRNLSHHEFLKADKNYQQAARIAKLQYMDDSRKGIQRIKKGKGFKYIFNGREIKNKSELERIKKLAIPPSWSEVWISPIEDGHLQATGLDLRKRKQYRYHTNWNELRNETKFHRLYEFGKALPKLRKRVQKDISLKELTENKVLAAVIRLMEQTHIRVGNNDYEKLYGSYGLTTLKDKHATIQKDKVLFSFTGKKGVAHEIAIKNKKLALIVKQCRDIPGKELFQYYLPDGRRKSIDSGMVNTYIQEAVGTDFSTKDFRTWAGSLCAVECFQKMGKLLPDTDIKKNIVLMLDEVSTKLGNTRNICKKHYVHPVLISLYGENKLFSYLDNSNSHIITTPGLSKEEKVLMQVLKTSV